MKVPQNIILSRTDGIGDMVLMLPMAAVIKKHFPEAKVAVLGKKYTRALVEACVYVDAFIEAEDFFDGEVFISGEKPDVFINVRTEKAAARRAKKLRIPVRIGTKSRGYHWRTCNRLVNLRRKKSGLHEAQLNLKLLEPLGISRFYSPAELGHLYGLDKLAALSSENASLIDKTKYNLILHPKSQGSSREWPIDHFAALVNFLPESRFNVFISGVEKEKPFIADLIGRLTRPVTDLGGKMAMEQFLPFIKACDGLIANATGPLHLAAALAVDAFGLYPPLRPLDPGRWSPLGPRTEVFVLDKNCSDCRNDKNYCACIHAIQPAVVAAAIDDARLKKFAADENYNA